MENEIKYQDWPERVKITTAFSIRKFHSNSYQIPLSLGYILFGAGILSLIYSIATLSDAEGYLSLLDPLAFIIIGLANLATGFSVKWILNNSSWEERFANKSSIAHKIIYLLISAILIGCLVVFFKL